MVCSKEQGYTKTAKATKSAIINNIKINRSSIYWPEINQITFITRIKHLKAGTYPKISAIKQYTFTIKLMKFLINNYYFLSETGKQFLFR